MIRPLDVTFDYDFDSNLYMFSKASDAKNWKVTLHCLNNKKTVALMDKFSAYPGCNEHSGETSWMIEGYRPEKIEIKRPGQQPVLIEHPDSKL